MVMSSGLVMAEEDPLNRHELAAFPSFKNSVPIEETLSLSGQSFLIYDQILLIYNAGFIS